MFNQTLERLEASFDQIGRFTADVSHQLRTPLAAIRSVGEVGLREPRDEVRYRAIIGSMLEEVDRLSDFVNRLLALSRAENNRAKPPAERMDLAALAGDVVAHLSVLAEEKRQSLVIQSEGPAEAIGDRTMVRQALINVVDNAIKYTPDGGAIRIRLSASRRLRHSRRHRRWARCGSGVRGKHLRALPQRRSGGRRGRSGAGPVDSQAGA